MDLEREFDFKLSDKLLRFHNGVGKDTTFHAKYNETSKRYVVTWNKDLHGGSGNTEYFLSQVEDAIESGNWIMIK